MDIKSTTPYVGESVRGAPVVKTVGDNNVRSSGAKDANQGVAINNTEVGKGDASSLQKKDVEQAVSDVNQFFQAERRSLSFSVNDTTNDVVIEVKDAETDEVIRQIPPDFVVKLAERLHELSNDDGFGGLLLKDKA